MIHRWGRQAQAWIYELFYMSVSSRFVKTTLIASAVEPFLLTPLTNFSFTLVLFSVMETWLPDITMRTTLSNGYLGSGNDEERSEPRYVMRIAVLRESSNL